DLVLATGSIPVKCVPDIQVKVALDQGKAQLLYQGAPDGNYSVRFTGADGVTIDGNSSAEHVLCEGCALSVTTDYTCPRYALSAIGTLEVLDANSNIVQTLSLHCLRADTQRLSAGDYHSISLDQQSRLWSWGYNGYGQLG